MAINFPSSPSSGDTHTAGGVVYAYDGVSWAGSSTVTPVDALSSGIAETFQTVTAITGNPIIDLDDGHIILCSALTGNVSFQLTNTGLSTNQATAVVVQITQGTTPRNATLSSIDGVSVTPLWSGGSTPTVYANKTDVFFFNISKGASSTTVLGHALSYG